MTDPRNISPRQDGILAVVGPWVSAIEHAIGGAPFLVKGLNLRQRDAKLRKVLEGYSSYIETDYSRFDMTLSHDWLTLVQNRIFTRILFPSGSFTPERDLFDQFLSLATQISAISRSGHSYKIVGTRCSGDTTTSIGNGLINKFNTWLCLRTLPSGSWTSIHEGDDGIIAVDEAVLQHAVDNLDLLNQCGFSVKSVVTNDLQSVSFCGRKFSCGDKLRTYADVSRTLSKFNCTTSQGDPQALLVAKALSYHHTDAFTPVLGPLCRAIISIYGSNVKLSHVLSAAKERYLTQDLLTFNYVEGLSVNESLRPSVHLTSGISICEQLRAEAMFAEWVNMGFVPSKFPKLQFESVIDADDRTIDFGNTYSMFFS